MISSSRASTAVAGFAILVIGMFALTTGTGFAALLHANDHGADADGHACAVCLHLDGNPADSPPVFLIPGHHGLDRMAADVPPSVTAATAAEPRPRAPPFPVSVP